VAATLVDANDEIMLITTGGVLIRTRVAEIREMGRATQGVTLIAVEDGTKLSGLQRVVETDLEETRAWNRRRNKQQGVLQPAKAAVRVSVRGFFYYRK
jgi:hypothetical protein